MIAAAVLSVTVAAALSLTVALAPQPESMPLRFPAWDLDLVDCENFGRPRAAAAYWQQRIDEAIDLALEEVERAYREGDAFCGLEATSILLEADDDATRRRVVERLEAASDEAAGDRRSWPAERMLRHADLGWLLLDAGRARAAVPHFAGALEALGHLEQAPAAAPATLNLGRARALRQAGQSVAAIEGYEAALRSFPADSRDAYFRDALRDEYVDYLDEMDRDDRATRFLVERLEALRSELGESSSAAVAQALELAEVLRRAGHLEEAITHFERVRAHPDVQEAGRFTTVAFRGLGAAQLTVGQRDRARASLEHGFQYVLLPCHTPEGQAPFRLPAPFRASQDAAIAMASLLEERGHVEHAERYRAWARTLAEAGRRDRASFRSSAQAWTDPITRMQPFGYGGSTGQQLDAALGTRPLNGFPDLPKPQRR